MKIAFLKRIGSAIVKAAKFVWNLLKNNNVAKTAEAVGAVATAITVVGGATITLVKKIRVHSMSKKIGQATQKKDDSKFVMGTDGKVHGGHKKDKKKKKKSMDPVSEFRDSMHKARKLYKLMSPEERKDLEKIWEEEEPGDVSIQRQAMKNSYHMWDDRKCDKWNEWEEIKAYAAALDQMDDAANPDSPNYRPRPDMMDDEAAALYTSDIAPRIKARQIVLEGLGKQYQKHILRDQRLVHAFPNETEKQKRLRWEMYADSAKTARKIFDQAVDDVYCNMTHGMTQGFIEPKPDEELSPKSVRSENLVDSNSTLPEVESVVSEMDDDLVMRELDYMGEENPQYNPIEQMPIELKRKVRGCEWVGDKFVVANIVNCKAIPEFYYRDPQPADPSIGNGKAPGFISIDMWTLGEPHEYAFPCEKEHNFDWSEFEGTSPHRNIECDSIKSAYDLGCDWCNANLEVAEVFKALFEHKGCIYPNHPQFPEFMAKFERCYWDLVRVVPGLGDYGHVFACPFDGGEDDDLKGYDMFFEANRAGQCYGKRNPPSPEKVMFEIIQAGFRKYQVIFDQITKDYPIEIMYKSPACLGDIFCMVMVAPPVLRSRKFPRILFSQCMDRLISEFGYYPGDGFIYPGQSYKPSISDPRMFYRSEAADIEDDDEDEPVEMASEYDERTLQRTPSLRGHKLAFDIDPQEASTTMKMAHQAGMSDVEMLLLASLMEED